MSLDTTNKKGLRQLFSPKEYNLVDDYMKSIGLQSLNEAPENDPSVVVRLFYAILGDQTKKRLSIKENKTSAIDFVIEKYADDHNKTFIALDELGKKKMVDSTSKTCSSNVEVFAQGIVSLVTDLRSGGEMTNENIDLTKQMFIEWSTLAVEYDFNKADPNGNLPEIQKMVRDRNAAWMSFLPSIIKKNAAFIAVGLGHLKYNDGILVRLRKLGYSVKPVKIERIKGK